MLSRILRTTIVAAALLLPTALAVHHPTRTLYLYGDGEPMTTDVPENDDPTGLDTLVVETENFPFSSFAPLDAPLHIPIGEAFRVHLEDRTPATPLGGEFTTRIVLFLTQADGVAVLNGTGGRWLLGETTHTFVHPGHGIRDSPGWREFVFDASATQPTENACNAYGCVSVGHGSVHLPRGVTIWMEIGLVASPRCALDLCGPYDAAFESAADTFASAIDAASGGSPVDPRDPLGPLIGQCHDPGSGETVSCLDLPSALEKALRDQDGDQIASASQAVAMPRSTWKSASTTSDSRLEIRLA